jgi:hypothetical protein
MRLWPKLHLLDAKKIEIWFVSNIMEFRTLSYKFNLKCKVVEHKKYVLHLMLLVLSL